MSAPRFAVLALLAGLGTLTGCGPSAGYIVQPTSREAVSEKLDAHWFLREIRDAQGLKYVELTYCPVQAGETVPVCRTSVVWTRGRSDLMPKKE